MSCKPEFSLKDGIEFDAGACAHDLFIGWIPGWVWEVLSWLPWIAGGVGIVLLIAILYRVWKIGGWPALTAAVGFTGGLAGFILGRTTGRKAPLPRAPQPPQAKQPRPTRQPSPPSKQPSWFEDVTGRKPR